MRVCFIGHQATKEGAGRFLLDQADYLLSKGVTVYAILPQRGMLCEALTQRGIECRIIVNPWWTKSKGVSSGPDYDFTLTAARQMADLFQQWQIDLVYTQTIVAPAGPLAAALSGKPHIWHIHEFAYNPEAIEMAISKESLTRLIDETANLVVFNSKAVAKEWEGCLPVEKTTVLYNWISVTENKEPKTEAVNPQTKFGAGPDCFVMAMVGSVNPWKRQKDAIEAVAHLVQAGCDIMLLIAGPATDGAYRDQLIDFVQQHKLEQRIRFLGYVENPAPITRAAKAALVCSRLEPFGRVTIESMSQGVAVIGSDSGGTPEIITDGVNGLLFPTGDVKALARQIRRLMQDEALRKSLCQNGAKRAKEFSSAETFMEPFLQRMTKLVGSRNPSWPVGELMARMPSALPMRELARLAMQKLSRRLRLHSN